MQAAKAGRGFGCAAAREATLARKLKRVPSFDVIMMALFALAEMPAGSGPLAGAARGWIMDGRMRARDWLDAPQCAPACANSEPGTGARRSEPSPRVPGALAQRRRDPAGSAPR